MFNQPQPASRHWKTQTLVSVSVFALLTGCQAKPDNIVAFRSPNSPVSYTVETSNGHGASSTDYTKIYAHYHHGSLSDTRLVLSGPYLGNTTIRWNTPTDINLCIGNGRTVEFWNHTTLSTDDNSQIEIHHHLNESC